MITRRVVVVLAALILALAFSSYGADTVTLAAPTVAGLVGTRLSPVPSPNGKNYCDYTFAIGGKVLAIRFRHTDPDGQIRYTNVVNENDIRDYVANDFVYLGYGLACLDDGAVFFSFDNLGNTTVWQSGTTVETFTPILSARQNIVTDGGTFRYNGGAIKALVRNGHPMIVTDTSTDTIAVEFIPGKANHLVANFGSNRYVLDVCATADALFAVDYYTGNYEKFPGGNASQILETIPDLGFNNNDDLVNQTYTLGCSSTTGALVFQQGGGLSMNTSGGTVTRHVVFGNNIAGYKPSDVDQLVVDASDAVYWAMTVPSKENIAESGIFSSVGGSPSLVYLPTNPIKLGLLNLFTGVFYYNAGRVGKSQ